jgi:hypothetical protein
VVWSVLALAMSGLIGLLMVLDGGSTGSHAPGVSLSPLLSVENTRGVDAIFNTSSPIEQGRWDSIVIVHSGSPAGTPASIGAKHESIGYDGLGFHFLIGNGTGMGDGEIHLGRRWLSQSSGAALSGIDTKRSERMIEICLIGDGDRGPFTTEQVRYLAMVVDALLQKTGISPDRVYLHDELASTTSPGRYFPRSSFRELLGSL